MAAALSPSAGPTAGPTAAIAADAQAGSLPLDVTFDASASSSEPPGGPLNHTWDLDGDGLFDDATGPIVSWTYRWPGVYPVRLRVDDGTAAAEAAVLITAGNEPPVPRIDLPSPSQPWSAASALAFAGSATDAEDGVLAPAAMRWELLLHDDPAAPAVVEQVTAQSRGTFTTPDHASPAEVSVCLTVTDAGFPQGTVSRWSSRKRLDVDRSPAQPGTVLHDFPLPVRLSDPDLRTVVHGGRVAQDDGGDFVFTTSSGERLAHEIEAYDPMTGALTAWVGLPELDGTTQLGLDLYFGNPASGDGWSPQGVWGGEHAGVWHLSAPHTPGGQVRDSSLAGVHGTLIDPQDGSGTVAGVFGDALQLSGDAHVDLGAPASLPAGLAPRTICAWARPDALDGLQWVAAYGSPLTAGAFFVGHGYGGRTLQGGGYYADVFAADHWEVAVWHHVCVTYDGEIARLYGDGQLLDQAARTWDLIPGVAYIGRHVSGGDHWGGAIDEVRVLSVALPPERIAAEFAVQAQDLVTAGPTEDHPPPLPLAGGAVERTACVGLDAATVALTLESDPPGMSLGLNHLFESTPVVGEVVAGSTNLLLAPAHQQLPGQELYWASWSDGGNQVHEVVAGPDPASFTALYDPNAVGLGRLLREASDLLRLTHRPTPGYVTRMASSYDRASDPPCAAGDPCWFSNADSGHFLAVEVNQGRTEYVMLDASGPGAVERIWTGTPAGTLRVYLDGASEPAIEENWSALGAGEVDWVPSPIAHAVGFGINVYLPIPFSGGCKITTDTPTWAGNQIYYQIAHRQYDPQANVRSFTLEEAQQLSSQVATLAGALAVPEAASAQAGGAVELQGTLLPGGGPLTLPVPQGVGPQAAIRRLSLRPSATDATALRTTLLEIAFDGTPTVSVPLGDFFGSGPGLNPYDSLPMSVEADGTLVSRWAMPFQHEVSLELQTAPGVDLDVEWSATVEPYVWADSSLYFHAGWRADHEVSGVPPLRDWHVLDTEGGGGWFVGLLLNVTNPFWAWWGEGEEKIRVDGESFPSHFGTGAEDRFGYAWAHATTFEHAYHNKTVRESLYNYGRASQNRWHVLDAIPFGDRLTFDLEQFYKGVSNDERRVAMEAIAYWYARPGTTDDMPSPVPAELVTLPVPPWSEREVPGVRLEGEAMTSPGVTTYDQNMQVFEIQDRLWSGHRQRLWTNADPDGRLDLVFSSDTDGPACLYAYFTGAPGYGRFSVEVNGQAPGGVLDLLAGEVLPFDPVELGVLTLHDSDANVLALQAEGTSGADVDLGLDVVTVFAADDPGPPAAVWLDDEALHWSPLQSPRHDVIHGDLALLVATGSAEASRLGCLASHSAGSSVPHGTPPAPGQGVWYLVRGDRCGAGSWDSGGPGQVPRDLGAAACP